MFLPLVGYDCRPGLVWLIWGEGPLRGGGGEGEGVTAEGERTEKQASGLGDDYTLTVDVNQRVLTFPTEEAGGDIVQRDVILVAHSAGGSERIIHKGEVVEEEVRGSFGVEDGLGDSIEGGSPPRQSAW